MKNFKFKLGEKVTDTIRKNEATVVSCSYACSRVTIDSKTTVKKSTRYVIDNGTTREERKSKELEKLALPKPEVKPTETKSEEKK